MVKNSCMFLQAYIPVCVSLALSDLKKKNTCKG